MLRDQHAFHRTALQIAEACKAAAEHHGARAAAYERDRGTEPEQIEHNRVVNVQRKAYHQAKAQEFGALEKAYREQPPETAYPLHRDDMAYFGLDGSAREE